MNEFDNRQIDRDSFAFADLVGMGRWQDFTPTFSLTVVGTPTYSGRYRRVGKKVEFQASFSASTSIASTAGTHYMDLPIAAKGIGGMAAMSNDTTNVPIGVCHIDVSTSRCYLTNQTASGNTFLVCGWYEI